MAQHPPVQIDKKVLRDAQKLWETYVSVSKKGVVFIAIVLAILGLVFV